MESTFAIYIQRYHAGGTGYYCNASITFGTSEKIFRMEMAYNNYLGDEFRGNLIVAFYYQEKKWGNVRSSEVDWSKININED